jgi:hypothetical protein
MSHGCGTRLVIWYVVRELASALIPRLILWSEKLLNVLMGFCGVAVHVLFAVNTL